MSSVISGLEYERVLDRVAGAVRSVLGSGRVPDQIPVLADADPHAFGLAVATVEGEVHGVGGVAQPPPTSLAGEECRLGG
jgi:glutaminase